MPLKPYPREKCSRIYALSNTSRIAKRDEHATKKVAGA
jgi:hypothetical protein